MSGFWSRFAIAALLGASTQWAAAVPTLVDLTATGSSATIDGSAIYSVPTSSIDASGSGVIDSFLRIHDSPVEEGYNSSSRPVQFDEDTGATFNHDLTIAALETNKVTVGGIEYYEFVLDGGEGGGPNRLISLDALEIFLAPSTTDTATCPTRYTPGAPSGTLCGLPAVYSLDSGTDYSIQLDFSNYSGNGQIDMIVLVPTALFGVAPDPTDKVYLYSRFGDIANTDSTFEEWARKTTGTFTPIPGTVLMLGAGLLAMGFVRRRTRA